MLVFCCPCDGGRNSPHVPFFMVDGTKRFLQSSSSWSMHLTITFLTRIFKAFPPLTGLSLLKAVNCHVPRLRHVLQAFRPVSCLSGSFSSDMAGVQLFPPTSSVVQRLRIFFPLREQEADCGGPKGYKPRWQMYRRGWLEVWWCSKFDPLVLSHSTMDNGTWTRGLGNTSQVPWQMAPVLWRRWLIGLASYYLWQQGGGGGKST